jgi:hypothetical protein
MEPGVLFARKEPTNDEGVLPEYRKELLDTCVYADADAQSLVLRYPWHFTETAPTRKRKTLYYACGLYKLRWLPDL